MNIATLFGADGGLGIEALDFSCVEMIKRTMALVTEYESFQSTAWFWSLEGSGEFTITSVRKMINDFMLSEMSSKTRWIKAVPIKLPNTLWNSNVGGEDAREVGEDRTLIVPIVEKG
nr:RNA-directed DNA polymerase, eukaryota [Tanacetum cinerariifolium]